MMTEIANISLNNKKERIYQITLIDAIVAYDEFLALSKEIDYSDPHFKYIDEFNFQYLVVEEKTSEEYVVDFKINLFKLFKDSLALMIGDHSVEFSHPIRKLEDEFKATLLIPIIVHKLDQSKKTGAYNHSSIFSNTLEKNIGLFSQFVGVYLTSENKNIFEEFIPQNIVFKKFTPEIH